MPSLETIQNILSDIDVDEHLIEKFYTITSFLSQNSQYANRSFQLERYNNCERDYIISFAHRFFTSRHCSSPSITRNIPDPVISIILKNYFSIEDSDISNAILHHKQAMAAENIIGNLLEHYLASILEDHDWIWCSGSIVRAVDFIKTNATHTEWTLLQVKNRNNSENSSSAAIRQGTTILHWFRTFAQTGATNWEAFPDSSLRNQLSEDNFQQFVCTYLSNLSR